LTDAFTTDNTGSGGVNILYSDDLILSGLRSTRDKYVIMQDSPGAMIKNSVVIDPTTYGIYMWYDYAHLVNVTVTGAPTALYLNNAGNNNITNSSFSATSYAMNLRFNPTRYNNIYRNTFNGSTADLKLWDTTARYNNIFLNHFYGGGLDDSWTYQDYCVNYDGVDEGNFYRYTIPRADRGDDECGTVDVIEPDGGENYVDTSPIFINWTRQSGFKPMTYGVWYSDDSGSSWYAIGSTSDTNYTWNASGKGGNQFLIRIIPHDTVVDGTYNWSHDDFSIIKNLSNVNVTYPEGLYEASGVYAKTVTLQTFTISFDNITVPVGGELECIMYTAKNSGGSFENRELSQTYPSGLVQSAASLSYDVQVGDPDGSRETSWFFNNCSIRDSGDNMVSSIPVTNQPVYVKTSDWIDGLVSADLANAFES